MTLFKGKLKLKLQSKMMLWFALVVLLPVIGLSYSGIRAYEDDVMHQAQEKVTADLNVATQVFQAKGTKAEIVNGKMVLGGSYIVNDNYEVVDTVKSMVGGTATIFQGDTRISTNVKKTDGQRAVGTQAAANVVDTVLKQGKRYTGRAWVVNAWYLTAYDPIVDSAGKVIGMLYVGTPEKPFTDLIDAFKTRSIYFGFGALVLVLAVSYFVSRGIAKPIRQVTEAAQAIASGNAPGKLDINSRDELGDMNKAFGDMIAYFNDLGEAAEGIARGDLDHKIEPKSPNDVIGLAFVRLADSIKDLSDQVRESAESLSASSSGLLEVAEEVEQGTNQVLVAMEQISQGSLEQAKSAGEATTTVESLSLVVQRVSGGAEEQGTAVTSVSESVNNISRAIESAVAATEQLAEASETAGSTASDGVEVINRTVEEMGNIRRTVKDSAARILALDERSQQIGSIIEKIDDIADRTNLLALNAAIEAARAGEHGLGFAVVANEVRRLAEGASTATKEVTDLVLAVQKDIHEAVAAMGEGSILVDNGARLADQAREALEAIVEAVSKASAQVAEIAQATQQMFVESMNVTSAIENVRLVVEQSSAAAVEMEDQAGDATQAVETIAAVSEENSAAVQEVTANCGSLREQSARMTESAQQLSQLATDLDELVGRFESSKPRTARVWEADQEPPRLTRLVEVRKAAGGRR